VTHYSHKNIVRGISEWGDKNGQNTRDFDTLDKHNQAIVDGINKYVKEDDELWCLGDWSFGGIENIWNFRKRIVCKNIHLIYGNHDHHIEKNKILSNCHFSKLGFTDGPFDTRVGKPWIQAQELFSSCQYVKELNYKGQLFFLSHYSHQVWNKSHKGSIHLFGHSHSTLEGIGKSMDVGIDNAYKMFGEYTPFNINEIIKIMSKIDVKIVDHHNSKTT